MSDSRPLRESLAKKCPYCHSNDIVLDKQGFLYRCICYSCETSGPRFPERDDAISAWNSLPHKLQWTKEKPKEKGFYWVRKKELDNAFTIGFVNSSTRATVFIGCEDFCCADDINCEWAGPIPEPEE